MKKISILLLVLITSMCSKPDAEFDNIKITPPNGWRAVQGVNNVVAIYELPLYDELGENFNPTLTLSGGENVKEVSDSFLKDTVQILSTSVENFELIYSGKSVSEKADARIVYSGIMGTYKLKWDMTFFIDGKYSYIITYTAELNDYEKHLTDYDRLVKSFKFN